MDLEKIAREMNTLVGSINANPITVGGQRYAPGTLRLETWRWENTPAGPRPAGTCSVVTGRVYWPLEVEFEF